MKKPNITVHLYRVYTPLNLHHKRAHKGHRSSTATTKTVKPAVESTRIPTTKVHLETPRSHLRGSDWEHLVFTRQPQIQVYLTWPRPLWLTWLFHVVPSNVHMSADFIKVISLHPLLQSEVNWAQVCGALCWQDKKVWLTAVKVPKSHSKNTLLLQVTMDHESCPADNLHKDSYCHCHTFSEILKSAKINTTNMH